MLCAIQDREEAGKLPPKELAGTVRLHKGDPSDYFLYSGRIAPVCKIDAHSHSDCLSIMNIQADKHMLSVLRGCAEQIGRSVGALVRGTGEPTCQLPPRFASFRSVWWPTGPPVKLCSPGWNFSLTFFRRSHHATGRAESGREFSCLPASLKTTPTVHYIVYSIFFLTQAIGPSNSLKRRGPRLA